jgi:sodium transport system permease protein
MYLREILVVFRKECRDGPRDRRSLIAMMLYALFGPVSVILLLQAMARQQEVPETLNVAVIGTAEAPDLIAKLADLGLRHIPAPVDPAAALRAGLIDLLLEIPDDFDRAVASGRQQALTLSFRSTKTHVAPRLARLELALKDLGRQETIKRLQGQGLAADFAEPWLIEKADLATPQERAARFLATLPIFLVMAVFLGGMNVSADLLAGERERGTLEPLLAHARPAFVFALGKWLAAALFNMTGLILTLLTTAVLLDKVPLPAFGFDQPFGLDGTWMTLAILAPLVLGATALQLLLSLSARNFKEAQTYLSLLLFLPAVPGFMIAAGSLEASPSLMVLPLIGQMHQVFDLLEGSVPTLATFLANASATLVGTAFLLVELSRRLGSERVLSR